MYLEFRPPLQFTPEMTDDEIAEMVDASIRWSPEKDLGTYFNRVPRGIRPAVGINNFIFRCPHCREEGLEVIRGRYLVCDSCESRWRVGGDSYLTDVRTGERRSSTEVFRHICQFPREIRDLDPLGAGYTHAAGVTVSREVEFPIQDELGQYDAVLREKGIDLIPVGEGETITISYDELQSISIEKRYGLQLRLKAVTYQLEFDKKRGGSLQWAIYLQMMLPELSRHLIRPMKEHYLTLPGDTPEPANNTTTEEA
jgi:hypothetical protein